MLSPRPFSFNPTFSGKWRPAVDTNYTPHSCCDADGTYGGDGALHLFACTPEFVTLLCGCCSRKAHSPAFQVVHLKSISSGAQVSIGAHESVYTRGNPLISILARTVPLSGRSDSPF
jgi:hypothetical protein